MRNSVLPSEDEDFPDTAHVRALEEFEVVGVHRNIFYTIEEHAEADCFLNSFFCDQPELLITLSRILAKAADA